MKKMIFLTLTFLFSQVSFSQSMVVHKNDQTAVTFVLAQIDSITFTSSMIGDSLVLWYPFNGNTLDSSGNNNNATGYGISYTTDRFGNATGAVRFDASGDSIIVSNASLLNNYIDFTLCVWVFYQGGGVNPRILSKGSGENMVADIYRQNGNRIEMSLLGSGPYRSDSTVAQNVWSFIAYVKQGSELRIYKNSVLASTFSGLGSVPPSSTRIRIGQGANGTVDYYLGRFDDVRLYNRPLSAVEILALYHEGGW